MNPDKKTRPRFRTTTKILAVALTATAGCASTGASGSRSEPAFSGAALVVVAPVSVPEAVPAGDAPPAAIAAAPAPSSEPSGAGEPPPAPAPSSEPSGAGEPPPAPAPPAEDPALLALRAELKSAGRDKALARKEHFRPLCDRDGYPLVGNLVMGKGKPPYSPSELCADLRGPAR